jgi:5,10-methenyltetrahydrofolate synthetase
MVSPPAFVKDASDPAAFRAALRQEKLAARRALDGTCHAALTARIEAHLRAWLGAHAPACLAFCAPINNEFDARPLAAELIAQGWRAAMPVVVAIDAPMTFHAWTPDAAMTNDRYGIPIPSSGENVAPDIVLLPLVAFDDAGFRLGYGGGYFDRTLAALVPRPIAIGVGFELARTASIRPQPHDLPLDLIVTEAGVMIPAR